MATDKEQEREASAVLAELAEAGDTESLARQAAEEVDVLLDGTAG